MAFADVASFFQQALVEINLILRNRDHVSGFVLLIRFQFIISFHKSS